MSQDPYASYLRQADDLFTRGDIVKAGQIWQAILKREPGHTLARERLLLVKQRLEVLAAREAPRQPPAPVPVPPVVSSVGTEALPWAAPEPAPEPVPESSPAPAPSAARLEPDRLVIEGCTLYDMGQVEDALRKWTQVLALDPTHRLAREYANGARRDLGLPPLEAVAAESLPAAPPAASPQAADARPVEEDLDKLLHEAVQLYDIGLLEDAVSKWERVLALDPDRTEVRAYLDQTRAELARRTPAAPLPPARPAGPDAGLLDLKLRQGEHLLNLQRPEEAAFTFQQALGLDPGNPRALQGLERCHRAALPAPPVAAPPEPVGRILMLEPEAESGARPQAVTPPAALVKPATGLRSGLTLPRLAEESLARLPWLRDPKILAAGVGGLIVIILGLGAFHSYRKDQALREAVKAARAAAIAPISREAQAVDLTETPAEIRNEAEAALDTDPLRAYLRAATLVQRNPGDAQAAELLEKAKAALPGGAVGATLDEYQKHLQAGDLDAAAQVMDALLRANPDDADLRRRAARLELALCSIHATQSRWEDAALDLERGRALFPDDKSWQARLKLLGQIRAMPKDQRGDWIGLLG